MSQWSQVSRIALCMAKVKVTESVSQWQGHLLSCSGQLKKVTKRPFSSSCRNWPIWMKRSTLEFVTWNNSRDQCVLFKLGEWVGLCICATIKGRVSGWGRNLSGNCGINGSQTQLPARSITRALPHDSSQLTNRRRQWARNNILTAVGTTTILADMFICRAVSIWSIFHDRH